MATDDVTHLRRAIAVARIARASGNRPFGAVLVDASGRELLTGENTQLTTRDCTGHAEANLLREAATRFDRETLRGCTLYASTEPCPMCAAALFWSGVGRLVFGMSGETLARLAGPGADALRLSARTVLAAGSHAVAVEGPLLEGEARETFDGFFDP